MDDWERSFLPEKHQQEPMKSVMSVPGETVPSHSPRPTLMVNSAPDISDWERSLSSAHPPVSFVMSSLWEPLLLSLLVLPLMIPELSPEVRMVVAHVRGH